MVHGTRAPIRLLGDNVNDTQIFEKYIAFVSKATGTPVIPSVEDGFTEEEIERFDELSAQVVAESAERAVAVASAPPGGSKAT